MTDDILSTTRAFQCLIEATAAALDSREEGEKLGIIAAWMDLDEAIAVVAAYTIFQRYERSHSPAIMISVFRTYCRPEILSAFIDFYGQMAAAISLNIGAIVERSENIASMISISDVARRGRELGWKSGWGYSLSAPFAAEWQSAF